VAFVDFEGGGGGGGGGEEDKNPIPAILLNVINCSVQNLALQPNMRSCCTSLVYA